MLRSKERLNEKRGVTIVALIITVVVLLILAGITIGQLTTKNTVITSATEAKEQGEINSEIRVVGSSASEARNSNKYGDVKEDKLQKALDGNTGTGKTEVTKLDTNTNKETLFLVEFTESKRIYVVDGKGNADFIGKKTDDGSNNLVIIRAVPEEIRIPQKDISVDITLMTLEETKGENVHIHYAWNEDKENEPNINEYSNPESIDGATGSEKGKEWDTTIKKTETDDGEFYLWVKVEIEGEDGETVIEKTEVFGPYNKIETEGEDPNIVIANGLNVETGMKYTYTGKNITPKIIVKDNNGTVLKEGTHYVVEYDNNSRINKGTYNFTVKGIGNYDKKEVRSSFEITAAEITEAKIEPTKFMYDGTTKEPRVTEVIAGNLGKIGSDNYTVTYSPSEFTGPGKGSVIIKGTGNYTGTITKNFEISGKIITAASVSLSETTFEYDGNSHTPTVIVKVGDTILTTENDYTIEYPTNVVDAGVKTITITSKEGGSYIGEAEVNYEITKRSLHVKAANKTREYGEANPELTYTYWNQVEGETPIFTGALTTAANISSGTGTYDILQGTLNIQDNNSFKVSNYKVVYEKGTLTITGRDINNADITATLSNSTFEYDGTAKEPTVTVKDGTETMTLGTDYTVTYSENTDAGEATVTIQGKGTYSGTKTLHFTITKRDLNVKADDKTRAYGEANPSFTYTYSGQVTGQTPDFNGALTTSANTTSNVGTYDILQGTLSLKDKNTFKASNYNLRFTKGTLTIEKRENSLSLTEEAQAGKTIYTKTSLDLSTLVKDGVGNLTYAIKTNGTTIGSTLSGSTLTAGTMSPDNDNNQTVVVTITADGGDNDKQKSVDATITVQKYTATMAWTATTPNTVEYGDTTKKATVTVTLPTGIPTGVGAGSVTYSSGNEAGLTINNTTGALTVVNGNNKSSVITATLSRTATVKAGTATKTITTKKNTTNPLKLTDEATAGKTIYTGTTLDLSTLVENGIGSLDYDITSNGTTTLSTLSGTGNKILTAGAMSEDNDNNQTVKVKITAEGNDNYESKSVEATITVQKYTRTLAFTKPTENTLTYNQTTEAEVSITGNGGTNNNHVAFTSGNTSVITATAIANTNKATLKAVKGTGTSVITATLPRTSTVKQATATKTITAKKETVNPISLTESASSGITKYTGETVDLSTLVENAQGTLNFQFVENENKTTTPSTISNGILTLGAMSETNDNNQTVKVRITAEGNDNYESKSVEVTITVQKYTRTLTFTKPTENTLTYNQTTEAEVSITGNGGTNDNNVAFTSGNTSVITATAIANTNKATLKAVKGTGSSVITATLPRTSTVKQATASKTITAKKETVNPIKLTDAAAAGLLKYTGETVTLSTLVKDAEGTLEYDFVENENKTTTPSTINNGILTLGAMSETNDNNQTVKVKIKAKGNDNFEEGSVEGTITVQKYTRTLTFTKPTGNTLTYNQEAEAEVSVTGNGGTNNNHVAFTSGNTSVITATAIANTNKATLKAVKGTGSSVITATLARTSTVKQATVTKEVTAQKATGYVTLDEDKNVVFGTASTTFDILTNHGGTLSVQETTSPDTAATVSLSGTRVTVNNLGGLPGGTQVKITVSCAETGNYTAASKVFTLTLGKGPNPIKVKDDINPIKTGSTIDLSTLVEDAEGTLSYEIVENGTTTPSTLSGNTLTAGAMSPDNDNDQTVKVKITASGNNTYLEGSVIVTITVEKYTRTLTITAPDGIEYNKTAEATVSISGNGGTANTAATITSGNTSVITATANGTNKANLKALTGTGSSVITATLPRTSTVKQATATKTVNATLGTPITTVAITGTATFGETLIANVTSESTGEKTYQWWYSDSPTATSGTNITGATNSTYTIANVNGTSMVGKYIGVTVTVGADTKFKASSANNITKAENNGTGPVAPKKITPPTASNKTYNGSEQTSFSAATGYTVTNNKGTNAGSYAGKAILSDKANTVWSDTNNTTDKTLNWTMAQATPSITLSATSGAVSYNNTATFKATTKSTPNAAGTLTAVSGTPANIGITGGASTNITATTAGVETTITYKALVGDGTSKITITFTPSDTTNFKTVTAEFNATAGRINPTTTVNITGTAKYGETLTANATSNSTGTKKYQWWYSTSSTATNGTNIGSATTTNTYTIGNVSGTSMVGKYIGVTVTTDEDTNYYASSAHDITDSSNDGTTDGKVTKKQITKPTAVTGLIYDGGTKAGVNNIPNTTYATLSSGAATGIDAGSYSAVYALTDTANLEWADGTTANVTVNWSIAPKALTITWGETTTWVYDGNSHKPTVTTPVTGVNGESVAIGVSGEQTNVGTYTATATPGTVTGGRAKGTNYSISNSTKGFSITKAKVTVPSSPAAKTYNGSSQNAGITAPAHSSIVTASSTTSATNAGTYNIVLALESANYMWDDESTGNKTVEWKINKYNLSNATVSAPDQTYDGTQKKPTVTAKMGSTTIPSADYDVTYGTNVNAGTGTFTITAKTTSTNYTGSKNGTFTINNAEITGTLTVTGTNTYGSKLTATITDLNPSNSNLTYQWYSNENNSTTGGEPIEGATGNEYTIGKGLVGKYIYVVVTATHDNYNNKEFKDVTDASNGSATVTKKQITKPTAVTGLTYKGTSQSGVNNIPSTTYATLNSGAATGINAGSYSAVYKLVDTANTEWADGTTANVTVNWSIGVKSVTVSWKEPFTWIYDGSSHVPALNSYTVAGENSETLNITVTGGQTNKGDYTATAGISSVTGGQAKKENYTITNSTHEFHITDAVISYDLNITGTATFGQTLTASVTNLVPSDANLTYQWWYSDSSTATSGTNITGATNSTYTIANVNGTSMVGKYIGVTVTAKKTNYSDKVKTAITGTSNSQDGTVKPKKITPPTASNKTYDGSEQTSFSAATGYTVSNNKGTNAGNYAGKAILSDKANTVWSDTENTTDKTLNWTMAQAEPSITLSAASGTVSYNSTATFKATTKSTPDAAGTLTATSGTSANVEITGGATNSITATSAGVEKTITYKGKTGTGSSTITVTFTPTDTTNFKTVSKTFTANTQKINDSPTVKITGTATFGQTLTATATSNSTGTKRYQWWYSESPTATTGEAIGSATTTNTYTIANVNGTSMVGKYIGVTLTVEADNNYNASSANDITDSGNNETGPVAPKKITPPTASNKTYNGSEQTSFSAATGYTVSNNKGTNAGSYAGKAILSDKANTVWSDTNNTTDKTLNWTIAQIEPNITLSAASGTVTYNQTATFKATTKSSLDAAGTLTATSGTPANVEITGGATNSITATSAGVEKTITYKGKTGTGSSTITVTFTPTDTTNFKTVSKTFTANTQKAAGYVTLEEDKGVVFGTASTTFSILTNHGGELSVTDDNATATVSRNGTTVTISNLATIAAGTEIKVTVTCAATNDHNAASAIFTLTVGKTTNPITVTANNLTYNGAAQNLVTTSNAQGDVYYSTTTQLTASNYTSGTKNTIPQGTNAGDYTVYYYTPGNANYGTKAGQVPVTIGKYNLSNATIAEIVAQNYTGSAITPTPAITVPIPSGNQTTLTSGTDFTYSYTSNTNPTNAAKVTITGKGNYTGTKTADFTIKPRVTFNANGGTGTMNAQYVSYNANTTLTQNAFTKTGYSFGGWATSEANANAGTVAYADKGTVKTTSNLSLYAIWNANSYTVTYDYATNGGTSATSTSATVNYGTAVSLTPTATKSGWTFVGWNTDSSATEKLTSYTMPANNVTLYAIYSKTITATVYYYNNQSTNVNKTIYNTATSANITLPTIASQTVGGVTYTARGYSEATTANGTVAENSGASVTLTANKTYYATYNASITATFYYNSNATNGSFTAANKTASATRYMNYTGSFEQTSLTIPTEVTGSKGKYNSTYVGVATAQNTMTSSTSATTANTKYYAVYRSEVTIYRPTSASAVSSTKVYRNEYLTAADGSTITTKLASGTTGTSDITAVDGIYGTLIGFANALNTNSNTYAAISNLRDSNATTVYARVTDSVTATFYYYSGSAQTNTTASGTRTIYCKTATATAYSHGAITVPTAVTGSTGPKGEAYAGVASAVSSTTAATVNTATTKYYAFYNGDGTGETVTATFYYNSNGTNGSFTAASKTATGTQVNNYTSTTNGTTYSTTKNSTTSNGSITIPTEVTGSKGKYNSTYVGVATAQNTMTSSTSATTANTKYYAVYRSEVTIYRPTSASAVSSTKVYRNEYLTAADGSTITTKLASTTTGTSDITAVDGIYGTLIGFANALNTNSNTYAAISNLRDSNATTVYARVTDSVTATFYYYSGSAQTSTTASGTRTIYCKTATATAYSHGTITVPTAVTGSTGPKGEAYAGVASAVSSTTAATVNTATTKYYAFYNGDGTGETVTATFYYNSNATNGSFTAASKTATGTQVNNYTSTTNGTTYSTTKNSTTSNGSITIPTEVTGSKGKYNSTYVGVATAQNTMTSSTSATTANTKYYAVYRSEVTIYRPTSASAVSSTKVYRNEYLTAADGSTITTKLASTTTGTSDITAVDGIYGTLIGFANALNTNSNTYAAISNLRDSNATTVYARVTDSVTATFYYNSNGTNGSFTAANTTASGTRTIYCKTATATEYSHGSITIPTEVTGSKGKYNSIYVGVATTYNTMASSTSVTTENTKYYAVYRTEVTIYRPTSASAVSSTKVYRNEYLTAANGSAIATKLASTTTGTSDITAVDGIYGTLIGFANALNTNSNTYAAISNLRDSNATTVYARVTDSVTATFYYNSNTTNGSFTAANTTASGTRTIYCKTATATEYSHGAITIPTTVTGSKGKYNSTYRGVATAQNTMASSTSATTENTKYYAVYRTEVTIYRPTSATEASSIKVYRNEYLTAADGSTITTKLASDTTGTSDITVVDGLFGTLTGFANAVNKTTITYADIEALRDSNATTAYAISTNTLTATFYYNSNATSGSFTAATKTANATATIYCKTTTTAIASGSYTIPTEVTGSVGKYNSAYVGVATAPNTMTSSTTASANYASFYAVYRTKVTIYRPTSLTAASAVTAYRNEYFTSTNAISTKLASGTTGTDDITEISGIKGTLVGFATAANTTTVTYNTISELRDSNTVTAYAISKDSVTATFYYNSNTTNGSFTAATKTATIAETTIYCTATNKATATGNYTIPTEVTSSVGKYNSEYIGLATAVNTMTSNTTASAGVATFYAVYRKNVTIYRPSSITAASGVAAYRNEYFTSTSEMTTKLASGTTGTSDITAVNGLKGTLVGFATAANTTTVTYNTISELRDSNAATVYAISTDTLTGTFYYNSNATNGSFTAASKTTTATGTIYCTSNTAATSSGDYTIPTEVTGSVGKYNSAYVGVATTYNTMTSSTTASTANTKFYAVYRSEVTIYRPTSASAVSSVKVYRNEYFTNAGATALTTKLASTTTGTGDITAVDGIYGTLIGFANALNTNSNTYAAISNLRDSNATTAYARVTDSVTATFYYNSNGTNGSFTAANTTANGTRTIYCKTATATEYSHGAITIPTAVTGSKGKYNSTYVGVATAQNTMTSSTSATTENTKYYAVYRTEVTIYRPTSASEASSIKVYRNEYLTAANGSTITTKLASTTTGTSDITVVDGLFGTLTGFANAVNKTTITYANIEALRDSNATTAYAVSSSSQTIKFYSGVSKATTNNVTQTNTHYCLNTTTATTSNGTITTPTPANITNWSALGWRDDTDAADKEINSGATITPAATTYYAVYGRTLTITYAANGGTGTVSDTAAPIYLNTNSTTTSPQTVTLSNTTFTKTGHTFSKWRIGSTDYDKNQSYNPNLAYNSAVADWTITATAQWTAINYTITINAGNGISKVALSGWTNTGTATMTKSLAYGTILDLSTVTPTFKNGYSGTSWAKTSGSGTLNGTSFTVGDGVATLTVSATTLAAPVPSISTSNTTKIYGSSDTTLTATQTTSYDSGVSVYYKFGNSTSASGTYTYGTASTTTTSTVSETSHYGAKYYKVQAYATDGTLTSTTATWSSNMSVTLTAATITFDANNGTLNGTSPLYAKKDATALYTTNTGTTTQAAPTATRDGYTFTGWYKEAAATTKILNADGSFTGTAQNGYTTATAWATTENKTLYAGWTITNYTITINAGNGISKVALSGWTNTGTATMTKSLAYGTTLDLSTVTPTFKNGYSGTSWTKTTGLGSLNGATFTVGAGTTTLTIDATTLAAPEPSISTANTTKIYGSSNTTLTATQTTIYDSGVSINYAFGYSIYEYETYTYDSASTTNTFIVSATSHYGEKYYKVKAYATDGILTSSTEIWDDDICVTLTAATITFDANSGTLSGTNPLYAKSGETVLYETDTDTTEGTIPTVEKEGEKYSLDGWYTAASGGNKVLNADGSFTGTAVSGYTTATTWATVENKTLYAQWTQEKYLITYDFNLDDMNSWEKQFEERFNISYNSSTGLSSVTSNVTTAWEYLYIPITTQVGETYTFKFDYQNPNGFGTLTVEEQENYYEGLGVQALNSIPYSDDALGENTLGIVYAQMEQTDTISYELTFTATRTTTYIAFNFGMCRDDTQINVNLGNFRFEQIVNRGNSLGYIASTSIQGQGKTFVNWNTAENGSGTAISSSTVPTGDTTYYGKYNTATVCNVFYGGTGAAIAYSGTGRFDSLYNNGNAHSSTITSWKALENRANRPATVTDGTWGADYLQFNGTSTWVNLGAISNYTDLTLEVLFSPTETVSSIQEILSNIQSAGAGIGLTATGQIFGRAWIEEIGEYRYVESGVTVETNKMYHAALTYDGERLKIYVNGSLKATNIVSGTIKETTTVMALGTNPSDQSSAGYFFKGRIYGATVYRSLRKPTHVFEEAGTKVTSGGKYGRLITPTRNGYTFEGWYKDTALTQKIEENTTVTATGDHMIYAKWLPNTANTVKVTIKKDNDNWTNSGINVALYSGGVEIYNYSRDGIVNGSTVTFDGVENGTYDVYASKTKAGVTTLGDTGIDVTVTGSGDIPTTTIDYYTVTRTQGTNTTLTTKLDSSNGTAITATTQVLKNTNVYIEGTASQGYQLALMVDGATFTSGNSKTITATTTIETIATLVKVPTINVTDHNTFSFSSTGAAGYYVSKTNTPPTAGTTSSTFALNTWTTATSTGNLTLAEGEIYYVWAESGANGTVSAGAASIAVRKVTRSAGTGTTLTTKYDSSSGSSFTTTPVYVLNGSKINVTGSVSTGYHGLVLKNGSATITAGDQIINANASFTSSATINKLTINYYPNGATKNGTTTINGSNVLDTRTYNYNATSFANYGLPDYDSSSGTWELIKTNYSSTGYWHVGSGTSTTKISQSTTYATTQDLANAMGKLSAFQTGDVTVNIYAGWETAHYSITKSTGASTVFRATLAQAVAIADSTGSTIRLLANYTDGSSVTVNKTVVFDLNSKTLTRASNSITTSSGTFTIQNGTYNSTGDVAAISSSGGSIKAGVSGKGVTISSQGFGIRFTAGSGTLTVTGSKISTSGTASKGRAPIREESGGGGNITITDSNIYTPHRDKQAIAVYKPNVTVTITSTADNKTSVGHGNGDTVGAGSDPSSTEAVAGVGIYGENITLNVKGYARILSGRYGGPTIVARGKKAKINISENASVYQNNTENSDIWLASTSTQSTVTLNTSRYLYTLGYYIVNADPSDTTITYTKGKIGTCDTPSKKRFFCRNQAKYETFAFPTSTTNDYTYSLTSVTNGAVQSTSTYKYYKHTK